MKRHSILCAAGLFVALLCGKVQSYAPISCPNIGEDPVEITGKEGVAVMHST